MQCQPIQLIKPRLPVMHTSGRQEKAVHLSQMVVDQNSLKHFQDREKGERKGEKATTTPTAPWRHEKRPDSVG